MSHAHAMHPGEHPPFASTSLTLRLLASLCVLALLTLAICVGGRWLGNRISLAGNSDSMEIIDVAIGRDRLAFPANVIRFSSQRRSGLADRVDLYLTWPDMRGYSKTDRARFDDINRSSDLIFLQVTEAIMSRDMSGRFAPIYSNLIEPAAKPFRAGLVMHALKREAGYDDEVLLTAPRAGQPDYVVRCILPSASEKPTSADCQRDIKVGRDLSVLYRFSSVHLDDWQRLDDAVRSFVSDRLVAAQAQNPQPAGQ